MSDWVNRALAYLIVEIAEWYDPYHFRDCIDNSNGISKWIDAVHNELINGEFEKHEIFVRKFRDDLIEDGIEINDQRDLLSLCEVVLESLSDLKFIKGEMMNG